MRKKDTYHDEEEEFTEPSKSELKRRMTALQEMGESLILLGDKQLAKIPIGDERLVLAIQETKRIKSNNARRRHMQFIGRLMRDIDVEPIEKALAEIRAQRQDKNNIFHLLELIRDEVLEAGLKGVEIVMDRWDFADRQQLRQFILQHQREMKQKKPPAASRKLFKYLRSLHEQQPLQP
ncbi:MAG: ribosome-associated protein [Halioglobus sp.]|jgi:ribosome-associated protein